jgi:tetratricopeptide (TPR) repeat protein
MTEMRKTTSFKATIGAGVAGLLLAASAQLAIADTPRHPAYVMTVVADQAEGERMIAGEYAEAIAQITTPKTVKQSFAVSNNLCVAYTKTNDLPSAGQACAAALRASRTSFGAWYASYGKRVDQALALSNRGVIRAITGDVDGARSDFEQAARLNDKLTAAAENLVRLESQEAQTVSTL